MKKLILLLSTAVLMQACVATPEPPAPKPPSSATSKEDRFNRFSVKAIKERREKEYQKKLVELAEKNPAEEVQKAISNNQLHLLMYQSGRSSPTKIPGLTQEQLKNMRCQLTQIDGMGDTIYGKNHLEYRKAIREYATQFNLAMYPYCQ